MTYANYLKQLAGKTLYISDNDDTPWITLWIDDDEGDRGEIVDVGEDFCVLRYKRRLRKDVIRTVPLSAISVIADA